MRIFSDTVRKTFWLFLWRRARIVRAPNTSDHQEVLMNRLAKVSVFAGALLCLTLTGMYASSQNVLSEKQISLALATEAATETVRKCRQDGFRVTVVVLDGGGDTKVVMRDDGAGLHTEDSARRKAFTSLTFRIPSAEFTRRVASTPALASFEGVIALPGGLPIKSGEEVIGSIGVGGAPSGERDETCAQAGLDKIKGRL
jgi:uncharacterized protein GlcG (DUF336 family)